MEPVPLQRHPVIARHKKLSDYLMLVHLVMAVWLVIDMSVVRDMNQKIGVVSSPLALSHVCVSVPGSIVNLPFFLYAMTILSSIELCGVIGRCTGPWRRRPERVSKNESSVCLWWITVFTSVLISGWCTESFGQWYAGRAGPTCATVMREIIYSVSGGLIAQWIQTGLVLVTACSLSRSNRVVPVIEP